MNAPVATCPCCGQPVAPGQFQSAVLSRTLGLTGVRAALVDALARSAGQWVPAQRIIAAMYADDPDGGPLTAESVLRSLSSRIRPALARAGYALEARHGGRGGGSYRRLVRVSA